MVEPVLVGILSDTHDNLAQAEAAVSRFNKEGVELVLHAGDYVAPFMIGTLKDLVAPMTGVFGNNDGDHALLLAKCSEYPHLTIAGPFARIEEGGVSIGLMHGHDRRLFETLCSCSALDVLVYGHTHKPEVRRQGPLLIINPGEVYGHLTGKSTIAVLDTKSRKVRILEI